MYKLDIEDVEVIESAVKDFRNKYPEAYKNNSDLQLIIGILDSGGSFGVMAARKGIQIMEIQRRLDVLLTKYDKDIPRAGVQAIFDSLKMFGK